MIVITAIFILASRLNTRINLEFPAGFYMSKATPCMQK